MEDRIINKADLSPWPLHEGDAALGAAVLARAFQTNPLFQAAAPDPAERMQLTQAIFTANLRHACRYGEVWAAGVTPGVAQGVVYWLIRPEPELTGAEAAELGFADLSARWGAALTVLGSLEQHALQPLAGLAGPWRYLAAVGVDPSVQGKGLGTLLVSKVVEDARGAGLRCGIVTDTARNVPLYQRCGFALVQDGIGPDGQTRLWTMVTAPVGD